jgi:hypothetical protein
MVAGPAAKLGASFTGVTLMLRPAVALRPPSPASASVTVHLLLPNALAAGLKLSTPAASTAGATANSAAAALSQVVLKVTFCSSPGPAEMSVAQAALYAPESSATLMLLSVTLKLGASFTAGQQRCCEQHAVSVACFKTIIDVVNCNGYV